MTGVAMQAGGKTTGGIYALAAGILAAGLMAFMPPAQAAEQAAEPALAEPHLRLVKAGQGTSAPMVALTFDLCMGRVDRRIFDLLLREKIPATLFVTGRWLGNAENAEALAQLRANPQLFQIGNHGARHLPPIDSRSRIYGLKTAGSIAAVCAELAGGAKAIQKAGLAGQMGSALWYRGAAALYSPDIAELLPREGWHLAGFSLNGDEGASLSAAAAQERIEAAQDGDVVIAHMNQPSRPAGAGVAAAIEALRQEGYHFATLEQAAEAGRAPEQHMGVFPPGAKLAEPDAQTEAHAGCAAPRAAEF